MTTTCPDCGTTLHIDDAAMSERPPCPNCGSDRVTVAAVGTVLASATLRATGVVSWPWPRLLETACHLNRDGHCGPAVVVAQSACEVVVARAMSKAYKDKGVPDLEEPVGNYLYMKALTNENMRKLYGALTDDTNINQQGFWSDYTTMVKLRHEVAHAGKHVGPNAARTAIDAAKAFVEHVAQHNKLLDTDKTDD